MSFDKSAIEDNETAISLINDVLKSLNLINYSYEILKYYSLACN